VHCVTQLVLVAAFFTAVNITITEFDLRDGGVTEYLMDELEEGVVLLEETTRNVLMANKTAIDFKIHRGSDRSIDLVRDKQLVSLKHEVFSPVDTSIFSSKIVDPVPTI